MDFLFPTQRCHRIKDRFQYHIHVFNRRDYGHLCRDRLCRRRPLRPSHHHPRSLLTPYGTIYSQAKLRPLSTPRIGVGQPASLLHMDHPPQSRQRSFVGTIWHLSLPRDLEQLDLYLGVNTTRPPLGIFRTKNSWRHLRPHRHLNIPPFDASVSDTKQSG